MSCCACFQRVGDKMRALVVFLLAVLGCSLAQGIVLTNCELRDELMKAISNLPEKAKQRGLTVENLMAKIVCHVAYGSGFNTSAVNQLTPEKGQHHSRGKRGAGYEGLFSLAELEEPSVTISPHTQGRRQARQVPENTKSTPPTRPPRVGGEVWTLYGIFQLSNHLVCSDGTTPSPNICMMDCNNLVDNNIQDDISCLLRIFSDLVENGFGALHLDKLTRMIRLIYQEECQDEEASKYLADC